MIYNLPNKNYSFLDIVHSGYDFLPNINPLVILLIGASLY